VSAYMRQLHMIHPGEKVIVGLSGGADSVCLFDILLALREEFSFTVEAVHVNHMLRETAERDEMFVKRLCEEEGIVLHILRKDVAELAKWRDMSLEEAGREVRYAFFEEVAEKTSADKVAVAHHANDNAETILFHLCRGTGIDGLCGIRPVRDRVIRPLLCLERKEIEDYVDTVGRAYMTDETNADTAYTRNRIRNDILPMLEEVCQSAATHIAQTGELMTQVSDYLKLQAREAMDTCVDTEKIDEGCLRLTCSAWNNLHDYMKGEVIRMCIFLLAGNRKDISKVHVEAVRNLASLQVGSRCNLPYGIAAEKSYDCIFFQKETEEVPPKEPFEVTVNTEFLEQGVQVSLPDGRVMYLQVVDCDPEAEIPTKTYTKWLDYDKIKEPLMVRSPRRDDFFYFDNKNRKYVKDYMVNEKIPSAERDKCILVTSGSRMLYFVDGRISHHVKIDETTRRILKITVTGG